MCMKHRECHCGIVPDIVTELPDATVHYRQHVNKTSFTVFKKIRRVSIDDAWCLAQTGSFIATSATQYFIQRDTLLAVICTAVTSFLLLITLWTHIESIRRREGKEPRRFPRF